MIESDRDGGRRRWLWILPLVLCVVLFVTAAALTAKRRELAQTVIQSQLRALGLDHVTHEIESIGFSRIRVRGFRIGLVDDVAADEIEARYSLPNLRVGRIDALEIRGLRVRGRLDADGLSLGALDPLLKSDAGGATGSAQPFALPVAELSIHDFALTLETGHGLLDSTGALTARVSEDGTIELDFTATATHPQIGLDTRIEATGKATAGASEIVFDVTAKSAELELVLRAKGRHDLVSGSGEAHIDTDPIELRNGGLQPAALLPQLQGLIETATGSLEATGTIHWSADAGIRSGFDVALRDLGLASPQGSIENLNAALHVDGPWPLSTPAKQLVSMAQIDFGLQLQNGLIAFQLRPDGLLDVSAAEWTLAGGKVHTRGRFDPFAASQKLMLELTDLDLSKLLELVDLTGLTGSGRLSGHIPLRRRGTTVEIREGVLSATPAGGWIRYQPDTGIAGIAGQNQGQGFNVVLDALRNFHFRELSATLDGDTEGPVNVAIHLAGANPDYLSGHPVEFNLNVDAHLVDLLRKANSIYRIPQQIEEKLTKISGGKR